MNKTRAVEGGRALAADVRRPALGTRAVVRLVAVVVGVVGLEPVKTPADVLVPDPVLDMRKRVFVAVVLARVALVVALRLVGVVLLFVAIAIITGGGGGCSDSGGQDCQGGGLQDGLAKHGQFPSWVWVSGGLVTADDVTLGKYLRRDL